MDRGGWRPRRVLHLSLCRSHAEPQAGLEAALARLGPYQKVPWRVTAQQRGQSAMEQEVIRAAAEHRPELVFCQVQSEGFGADLLRRVRAVCAPGAVIVNWTGDVRTGLAEPVQRWQPELCGGLDLFLASNCTYPERLVADEGVGCFAGYMLCGCDETECYPSAAGEGPRTGRGVAFCGSAGPLYGGRRTALVQRLCREFPRQVSVRGGGWGAVAGVDCPGPATRHERRVQYHGAAVVLCQSLYQDLRRYTSGRLPDALGCGVVAAVQAFDDWEGTGVRDGETALVWRDADDLVVILRDWLRPERAADRARVGAAAAALAAERMTWGRVIGEQLTALVVEVERRRKC
jgi:hypothetical protein